MPSVRSLALLVWLLLTSSTTVRAESLARFEFEQPKMGTLFRLVMYAPDEATANKAAEAAWARVDELNAILSDYDPHSELSRLSHLTDEGPMKEPVHVSDDLWNV